MNTPVRIPETKYDYPTAFCRWGSEEWSAIHRVLASGQFTMGREVEAFEAEFADYHGMRHAVMVNSGSSANLVAVEAAIFRGGCGRVASVPALAWSTTYAPLIQRGFHLKVRDCDDTWNAEQARDDSGLFIDCPILGNPISAYRAYRSDTDGRPIIVDNCESIGAVNDGGDLSGRQGILNTFSFYWSHQLSAIEGGMILTDDVVLAKYCRLLRNHGWTRSVEGVRAFEDEYRFALMGYNLRPLEMHAAIAREQLRKLDGAIKERTKNFDYFRHMAEKHEIPAVFPVIHGKPSYFGIHFTLPSSEARARVVTALRSSGIDCRPPCAGSLRKQPYGKRWADQATPNADRIHDTGIMLGNPPYPIEPLIDRAVSVMREVL